MILLLVIHMFTIQSALAFGDVLMPNWGCCKPTCARQNEADFVSGPVRTCDVGGNEIVDNGTQSACDEGKGYMCQEHVCLHFDLIFRHISI